MDRRAISRASLPNAEYKEIPGTHMSSVTKPELGEAIAAFLAGLTRLSSRFQSGRASELRSDSGES